MREIRKEGGEATYVTADVSRFDQVKKVADAAVKKFRRIDTWVHLAAVSIYAKFEDTTPEEFRRIVEVNLTGQAYGEMAALPHMKREGRGSLIHISSVEARRALPFQAAYAASKHGIKGFLEALRVELKKDGLDEIGVTEIMPASIDTPLFEKARTRIGVEPKGIPPVYKPERVVDAILRAAEHPEREVFVGGAGRAIAATGRVAPALADTFLSLIGFKGQKTAEAKSSHAGDNLYSPVRGAARVTGKRGSSSGWMGTAILGTAAGGAGMLAYRALRSRKEKDKEMAGRAF